jgi:hypothetical protein
VGAKALKVNSNLAMIPGVVCDGPALTGATASGIDGLLSSDPVPASGLQVIML